MITDSSRRGRNLGKVFWLCLFSQWNKKRDQLRVSVRREERHEIVWWVSRRNIELLGSVKDPFGLSGLEFKVRPVTTAVCFSPAKSETLKGMRRAACLLVLFKDVLSCTLGNMPLKEALSWEPRVFHKVSGLDRPSGEVWAASPNFPDLSFFTFPDFCASFLLAHVGEARWVSYCGVRLRCGTAPLL